MQGPPWASPSSPLCSSSAELLRCEFPQPLALACAVLPAETCPPVSGPVNLPNQNPSKVPQALGAPLLVPEKPGLQSCISMEDCLG